MTQPRILMLYNAASGSGNGRAIAEHARATLAHAGRDIVATALIDHGRHCANDVIARFRGQFDLVIVIGGDGTFREVVSVLLRLEVSATCGFIPVGNANVVARELGIPLDPYLAIQQLMQGTVRTIDVGQFTTDSGVTRYFVAMLEVGQGARLVHEVDRLRNGPLKSLYHCYSDIVYAIASLRGWRASDFPGFALRQGRAGLQERFHGAIICSMATYAKGWTVHPQARCDDGSIEILANRKATKASFFVIMFHALLRRALHKTWIHRGSSDAFSLDAHRPLTLHADGDPLESATRLSVKVLPGALDVLVPA